MWKEQMRETALSLWGDFFFLSFCAGLARLALVASSVGHLGVPCVALSTPLSLTHMDNP